MTAVVVNGRRHSIDGRTGMLIGWLRGPLGLTGTKPGCGEGECGACTVLLDGQPVLSCQTPIAEVAGRTVTTVEGLAIDGRLHPAQQALIEQHSFQCGYCAPAVALRLATLVEACPDPDDDAIADAMGIALCRCGCYARIRRAAHRAAELRREGTDRGLALGTGSVSEEAGDARPLARPSWPWDLLRPEERDYEAVLGPGLLCVWPAGQPPGSWAWQGGAWIHVAPSGAVTAFSGKVDVGQDNRTAFRLLVAEELGVEVTRVTVHQGDTDLCPYDPGTFGSRSMPDAGQALRLVAAGARRALAELSGPTGLGEGCRLVVVDTEPPLVAPLDRCVVGRRGHEARQTDAVTGARRFVSDLERPGMGHGAVLRPVVPGATLRSVDCSGARTLAGVTVVEQDSFVGVVADDPATARRGLAAIDAAWDEPPTMDEDLADYLRAHPLDGSGWERRVDETTGDVAGALAGAAHTHAATYTTAYLAHAPLETRAAVAEWEGSRLTVWTGTQVPFGVRRAVAGALGVDEAAIRVVVPPTGGAFGGKHAGEVATEAARLSQATGRPVKVHWSRAEELRWGTVRPMAVIDVAAALGQDGELAAWDFLDINAGPAALVPPYRTATRRLRYQPSRSPLRQGSYRALAATANNFARESMIDELAHHRGEDPLAFRVGRLDDERLVEVLRTAADRFNWTTGSRVRSSVPHQADAVRTGQGLAVGLEKGGRVATCAEVGVTPDGRVAVTRIVTAYDCGMVVNPDTVVNQIEGATMMALGGALVERLAVTGGRLSDPSLTRYPFLRFADLPDIEVVLCDHPDLPPAGAGETPMIAVAPAVAGAIFDATGRRLRNLPLTPGHRLPA